MDAKDVDMTPTAVNTPIAIGDVLAGKYRIDAVVGRGGMSVVYRATHLHLEQLVAIKVLSANALVMPEYVARLKREARAVSRIRSEHVVRVFDIGELPGHGIPYLVMEHLVGADLAQVLAKRGPLPVHLAVECILQACEALAEAHAAGIIHRDLKPANVFLTEGIDGSPCVKVLDFGISRMTRRHGLSPLTDPGIVLGTPSYMAPEQVESADTIHTLSDIRAQGAVPRPGVGGGGRGGWSGGRGSAPGRVSALRRLRPRGPAAGGGSPTGPGRCGGPSGPAPPKRPGGAARGPS